MSENQRIIDAIVLLNKGKYSERKAYLMEIAKNGATTINGFNFISDVWCWVVSKPTDISKQPQYKGESLHKVIPKNITGASEINAVLDSQLWFYI